MTLAVAVLAAVVGVQTGAIVWLGLRRNATVETLARAVIARDGRDLAVAERAVRERPQRHEEEIPRLDEVVG